MVSRAIKALDNIEEIIVHTGQHFDANMSDVFFKQLDIPSPQYNLHIAGLSHGATTGRMLEGIETLIQQEQPDWVLVYGDTNSTLAGARRRPSGIFRWRMLKPGYARITQPCQKKSTGTHRPRLQPTTVPHANGVKNLQEGFPFPAIGKSSTHAAQRIINTAMLCRCRVILP